MDQKLGFLFLLLSLFEAFGKYVYIENEVTWYEAQDYCRQNYTELAPVSSKHDIKLLKKLVDPDYFNSSNSRFWIGLERNLTDRDKWTWSGAGEVTKFFWGDGQPDSRSSEDYGMLRRKKWHNAKASKLIHFFCYNVIIVREKMTWVEALDYCREHHKDLASIASEAEMTLIWRELNKNDTTDHVWIGLRFFPGDWLWTDGQPTDYQAWSKEGKPGCPRVQIECAALRMKDEMPSTNGTNSTLAADSTSTTLFNQTIDPVDASGGRAATECVEEKVWEARDCEEKLYFVCY